MCVRMRMSLHEGMKKKVLPLTCSSNVRGDMVESSRIWIDGAVCVCACGGQGLVWYVHLWELLMAVL